VEGTARQEDTIKMSDNNLIQEFLTRVVDAEMVDDDHWLLTDIYYKAIRLHTHYDNFWEGYEENATDSSVIYDWWSEYLETAVSNEFLRKFLEENLYDEYIFSFLHAIHDKYETHIEKHYADMKAEAKAKEAEDFRKSLPTYECVLCEKPKYGYGNNPAPLITKGMSEDSKCCSKCNAVVVMARIGSAVSKEKLKPKNWISAIRTNDEKVRDIYEKMDGMWNRPELIAFEDEGKKPEHNDE
jgi:hypothetical protein